MYFMSICPLAHLMGGRPKFSEKGQLNMVNMQENYFAFVEDLRKKIMEATGFSEDKVYFERKGGPLAKTGDRLFIECVSSEAGREVCGIYIEELYQKYLHGMCLELMADDVVREINRVRQAGYFDDTRKLRSFEEAKDLLFIRLLNLERNQIDLSNALYRTVGDIALVLYMRIGKGDGYITSANIRKEYVESWGVSENQAFEQGMKNSCQMAPPRIYQWEKLIFDEGYTGDEFMEKENTCELKKDAMGNCLSTVTKTNGAAAIFMPGVAQQLGNLMGEDFYIVFTSVHEVMIHNERMVKPEELKEILVQTLQETTPYEDFLSDHVFHYNREKEEFSCVL